VTGGGFSAIRSHMPMNTNAVARAYGAAALARQDVCSDIERLCQVIHALRALPCVALCSPSVARPATNTARLPPPTPHGRENAGSWKCHTEAVLIGQKMKNTLPKQPATTHCHNTLPQHTASTHSA
jgi:hypothetical protein